MQKDNAFNKFYFHPNFFSYRFIPNFKNNMILISHVLFSQEKDSLQLHRFQFSKMI